ncbi:MAG: glutaminyl-peptide cyclotransferase [Mangrovimonas sp.]|nr:glutaminyl-peptide cyclotransferase [Mangrovimonas sp.]
MVFHKALTIILLGFLMISCGSTPEEKAKNLKLTTNAKNGSIPLGETLTFSLQNDQNYEISSTSFTLNGQPVEENKPITITKVGNQLLEATVFFGDKSATIKTNVTVLNNEAPKVYKFNILNTYPHDITSYTQGLEFHNGELYESTGQYGESKLRKVDYKTGEVLKNINLDKAYFGEGLTILDNKLYQLTWRRGIGFVYDVNTFEKTGSFKYGKSKEGWGLCNNGKVLYKTDGSEDIWILNTETLTEDDFLQVFTNKSGIGQLNEMEWIHGKIYANIYQRNGVAIINPETGGVEGVIDFTPLKNLVTQHPKLDVLNGIAYNPDTQTIFVTGKNWDKLFEIELVD